MKISREWLQTYFENELSAIDAIADALTFHAFEIESVENDILDVKVTANRGHDCLSHRGIAKELSAILDMPLKDAAHTLPLDIIGTSPTRELKVMIDDAALCGRYIGAYIRGAKVGPSPAWLRERLESIGQKSINNVVDAANFVMFDIGQPLHAFDAGKRTRKDDAYAIRVRLARDGESLVTLDEREQSLASSMLMIADGNSDELLGVAGVKGGKESGVSDATTDIILESANFDGPSLRKTARALKFRTDATQRFEQVISPELAAHGMRAFIELVLQEAGGELVGIVDEYPAPATMQTASVTRSHINRILGLSLEAEEIERVFARLGFVFEKRGETYAVTPPFERLDMALPEDIIEEVGRIIGYDKVPTTELPANGGTNQDASFREQLAVRGFLAGLGFSEVVTSVFADQGERVVANKADGVRPFLRDSLTPGLQAALERNMRNKDLLGVGQVKLFEIGTVWRGSEESMEIGIAVEKLKKQKTQEEYQKELDAAVPGLRDGDVPAVGLPDIRYVPFSKYPFITRDIAFWTPAGTEPEEALGIIREHAGELLMKSYLFDRFEKDNRASLAFRLVFQSMDRTLFDGDADTRMESISAALSQKGWEVR